MNIRSISQLLRDFQAAQSGARVSVADITAAFHERGFGALLLFFALPMALPLPVPPGINVLLASPLLLLTAQQALGRHAVWLPGWLQRKDMTRAKLDGILDAALPWLERLEMLTRPRMGFMTQGAASHIIGLLGFIMALSVCVPVPLTNTAPSFGIAVMALGILNRDGLAVLVGALAGTVWVAMLVSVVAIFGMEGIDLVKEAIKSWL